MDFKATIKKLREERENLVIEPRKLLDAAEKETRDFTADENTNYENMEKRFDAIGDEIKELETKQAAEEKRKKKLEDRENFLKSSQDPRRPLPDPADSGNPQDQHRKIQHEEIEKRLGITRVELIDGLRGWREQTNGYYATDEYRKTFNNFLRYGMPGLSGEERRAVEETRALSADSGKEGGYLVTPEQFIARLIQKLDRMVFVRQLGTVIPVPNAASLGAPALEDDPGDPVWTSEIRTGTEDSTMDFNKRELKPLPLARRIKVSKKLVRVSVLNVDNIIRDRLSYKFQVVEENNFLNGTGAGQPLGVFTASDHGITTGRDVYTGNTAASIKFDGLINAKYKLEAQYRNSSNLAWAFHRDAVSMIRKLKDGEGNYIWQSSVVSDKPDTILGIRYFESEYCPNTFSGSAYVGILGDWSFYWIADALDMDIQVLSELYAETNQNGYIARKETDGMPVLEDAFVRVRLV